MVRNIAVLQDIMRTSLSRRLKEFLFLVDHHGGRQHLALLATTVLFRATATIRMACHESVSLWNRVEVFLVRLPTLSIRVNTEIK